MLRFDQINEVYKSYVKKATVPKFSQLLEAIALETKRVS